MVHSHCCSSGSSVWVRGGRQETWNLCSRLWQPSFLWLIFTGPGGGHDPLGPTLVCYCVVAMAVERTKNSTFLLPLPSQCEQYNLLPWYPFFPLPLPSWMGIELIHDGKGNDTKIMNIMLLPSQCERDFRGVFISHMWLNPILTMPTVVIRSTPLLLWVELLKWAQVK